MTDAELLDATLAWVERQFGDDATRHGWADARELWEHMLACDYCSLGIGDDCGPFIEDNPAKPMHGPPIPRSMWSPLERILVDAYEPMVRQAVDGTLSFTAKLAGHQ